MLNLKVTHQTMLEPNNLIREKGSSKFANLLVAL